MLLFRAVVRAQTFWHLLDQGTEARRMSGLILVSKI
jgi:hypothetical protein